MISSFAKRKSNFFKEKITSFDANYVFRSSTVKARLTGYYTQMQDANEISFYFAMWFYMKVKGMHFLYENKSQNLLCS